MLPVALSIAGSDSSAGAGAQADLKTMSALGVYGVTAITCVVAEVPGKVSMIQAIEPRIVAEQIRLLFEAFPIGALKTGMLYSREIIATVCDTLEEIFSRGQRPPLVVDPVMVSTSGDLLLDPDAIDLYHRRLIALASVVTPNLDELAALLRTPIHTAEELKEAGRELARVHARPVLAKGGHLGLAEAIDFLIGGDADDGVLELTAPFVTGVSTHGTGCTYSAAITAGLARGLSLREAVIDAKKFVTGAIRGFLRWETGARTTDALHHFAPRS